MRNTTLDAVYSNKVNQTKFDKVDLFDGSQFKEEESKVTDEEKEKTSSNLPVPKIESLSSDGLLTIRFSKKMRVPEKYKNIEDSEVALRWLNAQGNVEGKNETYLTGTGFSDFEIRPALDLKVIPADDEL